MMSAAFYELGIEDRDVKFTLTVGGGERIQTRGSGTTACTVLHEPRS